jgi:hypothetical protein
LFCVRSYVLISKVLVILLSFVVPTDFLGVKLVRGLIVGRIALLALMTPRFPGKSIRLKAWMVIPIASVRVILEIAVGIVGMQKCN